VKIAVCDTEAIYPLIHLVKGPLTDVKDLSDVEDLVRAAVLHDDLVMQITPSAYEPEVDFPFTEEEKRAGGRNVITGIAPMLSEPKNLILLHGYQAQGEYFLISGWQVQFLPADDDLYREALAQAVSVEVFEIKT
jgi:hypothetical protein